MTLKQQVYSAINNTNFPDLKFIYSPEVLAIAPEVLEELLEEEKVDFYKRLETPDSEISFETFEDFSPLDYFFSLLEHYQGVHSDDTIRKIIEDFEPKYIDFGNEISYSKKYYEMLKICTDNNDLNTEQSRIIQKSIESYEVR
jgi:Zn-dependent oligopeptidase